jgi:hypothetical protein
LLTIPIGLTGAIYIAKYQRESTLITGHKINFHRDVEHIDFDNAIVCPMNIDR